MRTLPCWTAVLAAASIAAGQTRPAAPATVDVSVHLKLAEEAPLKASDVKMAAFPAGKRCAFTFFGCRSPKTIEVLTKLGFRTTVYCGPGASAASLKALEAAGADIGINVWGAKGTYSSHIGANTIQGAFDSVITSRLVLRGKCTGPLAAGAIGGHYGTTSWPIYRSPENRAGFGYAYHDGNYLILSDNKPYMVYLGRRDAPLMNRANFDNRIDSRRVPSEMIYYQIIANKFRGTLRRAEHGQIVRFSLRDFKAPDLEDCADVIGQFGKHDLIWHASEADIGANEYIRRKARVKDVQVKGTTAVVTLAIDEDVFPPFLLTPVPLALPGRVKVAKAAVGGVDCPVTAGDEAVAVDVPLRAAFTAGCRMSLKLGAPDMTVPDRLAAALTIENTSEKPITGARLRWVGNIGLSVAGGDAAAFDLPAKGRKTVQVTLTTAESARFGITPLAAVVTATAGGARRTFMEGFEAVVAPRLRVEANPMQRIPLRPGRWQYFYVHVDNKRSTTPGGPANTFISHKAGPCKGTISLGVPKGMTCEPAAQPFELAADARATAVFKVTNTAWDEQVAMVKPTIRFDGETRPVNVLFPGTSVVRAKGLIDVKPLDAAGLLVQANWDDRKLGGRFDRSCGNPSPHYFPGHGPAYTNEGVKGWCMNTQRVCQIHDTYKNIDYWQGTVCFYTRKDPFIRNENVYVPDPAVTAKFGAGRGNRGEMLFNAGLVQTDPASASGMTLRRFRGWKGRPGYLQLTYQMMQGRPVVCQAGPFAWEEKWRHVAIVWSVPERRLELYVDGKLVARAPKGEGDWHASPWDRAGPSGWTLIPITSDHGQQSFSCRDELYIYNRPLKPDEIIANMALARKK